MAVLVAPTTSQDGDIQDATFVDTASALIDVGEASSTSGSSIQGFWFMDTSSLTAGATVTAATLTININSFDGLTGRTWNIDGIAGALGSTLDVSDWQTSPLTFIGSFTDSTPLGSQVFSVPTSVINKTGTTNIHMYPVPDVTIPPNFVHIDSFENVSGLKAFLTITYTPAVSGGDSVTFLKPNDKHRYGWMKPVSHY